MFSGLTLCLVSALRVVVMISLFIQILLGNRKTIFETFVANVIIAGLKILKPIVTENISCYFQELNTVIALTVSI
jgi:hypothetical protein